MHKSRNVDQSFSLLSFVEHAVRARMSMSHTILQRLSASAKTSVFMARLFAGTHNIFGKRREGVRFLGRFIFFEGLWWFFQFFNFFEIFWEGRIRVCELFCFVLGILLNIIIMFESFSVFCSK